MKYKNIEIKSGRILGLFDSFLSRLVVCCIHVALQSGASVDAADQVVTRNETLFGKIESVSTEAVQLLTRGSASAAREIGVSDVVMIQFSDEPQDLIEAKRRLVKNNFVGALEAIQQVDEDEIQSASVAVRGEYAYVRAVAGGHVAMGAGGKISSALSSIKNAIDQFTRSIHYYELLEVAGDLEQALGRYDEAASLYKKIALGPPPMLVRAGRLKGDVLAAEGRYPEAIEEFEKVQSVDLVGGFVEEEKMMACLGQAESLLSLGRFSEAASLIRTMLSGSRPEEVPIATTNVLLGNAYSLLGRALAEMKQDQDALIAYLTVDLVYGDAPDTHAEALFHLFQLWNRGGYPRRAEEVRKRLMKTYPKSTWATELNPSTK